MAIVASWPTGDETDEKGPTDVGLPTRRTRKARREWTRWYTIEDRGRGVLSRCSTYVDPSILAPICRQLN